MNKIGVVREEVELDMETGTALLAEYRPAYVKQSGDFDSIFSSDCEDKSGKSVADCYFPMARRYEVPVIEIIKGKTEEEGSVTLAVGKIVPADVDDGPAAMTEDEDIAAREGSFWKREAKLDADEAIERNFGKLNINKAPVISLEGGELSVSMAMEEITGHAPAGTYADRYMQAPSIRMKAPEGNWDQSGFIEVGSEEVQLPILQTCSRE